MTITVRLSAVLSRFAVDPTQGPADVANSTETLIDALEQAAVEPLIDAIGNTDCCCPCCDEHRDVLTRLAGGEVPR